MGALLVFHLGQLNETTSLWVTQACGRVSDAALPVWEEGNKTPPRRCGRLILNHWLG